jgi:hypothetical protein
MVDELESQEGLEQDQGNRRLAVAAILGSALAAGVIAYLLRRARQEPPPPVPPMRAWDRARELAFSEERAQATREFLFEKVLPELKPALLGILEEVEALVDDGFRRAEKAIKSL